jgi:anaerobic magnesium-protoporphyrin IX monomethyl ester cyclase
MGEITLVHMSPLPLTEDSFMERYLKQVPLGVLSLASYLARDGHRVDLKDYVLSQGGDPLTMETFLSFLGPPAKILGLSTLSVSLPYAVLAAQQIKSRHEETTIIMGGIGPSLIGERLMETFPFIDFIVRGEGELPLSRLISTGCADPASIAGVISRKGDGSVAGTAPQRIEDLDSLPLPDYSLIDFPSYPGENAHMVTMRGCPYGCTFCCCGQFWKRKLTMRSIGRILDEIDMLVHRFGVRTFNIEDDTFVIDRGRVMEFCRKLKEKRIPGLRWTSMARVDLIDENLLSAMAESGCVSLYFGIESGSDEVRSRLEGKSFSRDQALEKLRLAGKYMEEIVASFLWGFPFESLEQFLETIGMICYLEERDICRTRLSLLIPFPGTPLFERYKHLLRFSENLVNHKMKYYMGDEVRPLILAHPLLFSAFYHYDGPDMEKKQKFLEGFRENYRHESTSHQSPHSGALR